MGNDAAQETPFTCCGIDWHRSKLALPDGSFLHIAACPICKRPRPTEWSGLLTRMTEFCNVRDGTRILLNHDEARMVLENLGMIPAASTCSGLEIQQVGSGFRYGAVFPRE